MPVTVAQVDALLPQTQCGQCGYAGCWPYANAIVKEQASLNRCPPGGVQTQAGIAALLNQPLSSKDIEAVSSQTQLPAVAVVRAADCIGCTKCIQACPVDAILGAAKQLHTIINSECTGCGLCVEPCPVNCIELVEIPAKVYSTNKARTRYLAKQLRAKASALNDAVAISTQKDVQVNQRQAYIQAAITRAKNKKLPG